MDKTFKDFDKFGLKSFADDLTEYLLVESQFVDESFVLSLNSEFGSGKTTFFEMWVNKLKSEDNKKFEVIYLNAWESDFQGDPLLAIVSRLLEALQPTENNEREIQETAGRLCKFGLSIGNDIIQRFIGINIIKSGQYAESKDGISKPESGSTCFQLYQEKQNLFKELKTLLRNFIESSKYPILIIIDELDRCNPNYAIEFLETIKHFFDIKGLIFALGVDKKQLASSAKALFGQDLDFDEYYRKFAHRNITLSVKSPSKIESFCGELVKEYLTEEAFSKKNRFSYAQHDSYRTNEIVDLCMTFSMNARQIHEFFRIAAHLFSMGKKPNAHLSWGWHIGVFFMVAISITKPHIYDKIGKIKIPISEFTQFLKPLKLFNKEKDERYTIFWAFLLYIGTFGNNPNISLQREFQNLGICDPSESKENFREKLNQFTHGLSTWGRGRDPIFADIYRRLEELRTFERE